MFRVRARANAASVDARPFSTRRRGLGSTNPAKAVTLRQVAWACALGLVGTAGIAVPTHRSFSVPQSSSRPVAAAVTQPPLGSFVAPVSTRVVTLPTVVQTADGGVRCVVAPAAGTSRVDCELLSATGLVAPAGGDGCGERWGASVRLAGSASLTCSAPLPRAAGIVLGRRDVVRTADVLCASGPAGVQCANVSTGVGFRIQQQTGIRLFNAAQTVA